MNVIEQLIPIRHPNRPGTKLEAFRALVFHYTANDNPGASDTMNAKYFARDWHIGADGKPAEWRWKKMPDGTQRKYEIPFAYGSAHTVADEDSVTIAVPTDEVAWACGDRALPYDNGYKGQTRLASVMFGNRQNYQTVSIEICNNSDWQRACDNAAEWAAGFLRSKGLRVNVEASISRDICKPVPGTIPLFRHYDLTGKMCPKPFIENLPAWTDFVHNVASRI